MTLTPDSLNVPLHEIHEQAAALSAKVKAARESAKSASAVGLYPPQLLWVVGEQHLDAWTNAAEHLHANAHITTPLGHRPDRNKPCDPCWRAAAYAVKGVLLAGYQKTNATLEDRPMTEPIDLAAEAKTDAKVQAALRKLANAAVELHLALAALGADHPHIGSDAMALIPDLMGEAIQDGLSRVTVTGWATTVRVGVHRDATKEG